MHLPRSVFSQRQLGIFLKVNDVDDVPSVKSIQTLNAMLQKMCRVVQRCSWTLISRQQSLANYSPGMYSTS